MKQERINEIIGLMFLAISLFTFWSLLTYDVHDNPFFTSHPNTTIHNGAGLIGAYLSYFLMFAFGYSSYTFPLIFLFWAISFLVQKIPVKLFFKIVGFLIFQSSTATVFSLLSPEARQFAMGGIWGYFLSANLSTYFGFGGGLIIVDFGTAVTFDIVSKRGEYEGGIIVPGMETSLGLLSERAALLPKIRLKEPKTLVGKDTVESMRSGILNGYGELCRGLIYRIRKEKGKPCKTVLTGGHSKLISKFCHFDYIQPYLTLNGLYLLYRESQR